MMVLTQRSSAIWSALVGAIFTFSAPAFAATLGNTRLERPIYGFVQAGSYEQDLRKDFQLGLGAGTRFSAQGISYDLDDQEAAFSAGLGYQLLPWLAAELSYSDFDPLKLSAITELPNLKFASVLQTTALALDAVAQWDFSPDWHASARLGAARWDAGIVSAVLAPRELINDARLADSEVSLKFGLGLGYQISAQLGLSLQVDQFQVDSSKLGIDAPLRTLSARASWRF